MPISIVRIWILTLTLVLMPMPAAWAQYQPVTDREFTIDIFQNTVLGSVRTVSMGGATTALAQGSVGMLSNPASPAVRPETSNDDWDWDWHIDWLTPSLGSDFDNNGLATDQAFAVSPLLTFGVVLQDRRWAFGVAGDVSQRQVRVPGGTVEPSTMVGRALVAYSFAEITVGGGLRTGTFSMRHVADAAGGGTGANVKLFEITGASLEAGAIWRPRDVDMRVGVAASLPVVGRDIVTEDCDPLDCQGFILPNQVRVPWRVAVGVAWRFAPTRWNRQVNAPFRDERHVIVSADVVLDGAAEDGHTIEGFIEQVLQPSGRTISTSVRLGAEYEWLPGRLRVRAGSYWEPGRVPGIGGRLHATLGGDVRVLSFCLFRDRYRLQLSLTADVAERYGNTGVSVGLWH